MASTGKDQNSLRYEGSNFLKQRLILSTLSGKTLKIHNIRVANSNNTGLQPYELDLIELFEKVTEGSSITVDRSRRSLTYQPGLLYGGKVHHKCDPQRGIGYYLDVLLALGPFCKNALDVTLTGVTNSRESPSVDHIKAAALPVLKRFMLVEGGAELNIVRRGMMPDGGGEVLFRCPVQKALKAVNVTNDGMVKHIRGTAYSCRLMPTIVNRVVESSKGVMLNFLPDVFINNAQCNQRTSGNSPGYGVNLVAETSEGVFFSSECISKTLQEKSKEKSSELTTPEDIGRDAAYRLLEEINRGGCVDSSFQWLVTLYMTLSQKDVTKYQIGALSQYTIHFLQHLREFFGITFKLDTAVSNDEDSDEVNDSRGANKVILTCVGMGYSNITKRVL